MMRYAWVLTETSASRIDGYERVDLQAFYSGFKDLRIALQVRNVFDEKYVETLEPSSTSTHNRKLSVNRV